MIHGNRQARAANQARALIAIGVALVILVVTLLASRSAEVSFQMPWKSIATVIVAGLVLGFYRVRQR